MLLNENAYFQILEDIKTQIRTTQYQAALGANQELMQLYWSVGKAIIDNTRYGAQFIQNLSRDITSEFPDMKGFSVTNLKYMRMFAEAYPDFQKRSTGR